MSSNAIARHIIISDFAVALICVQVECMRKRSTSYVLRNFTQDEKMVYAQID